MNGNPKDGDAVCLARPPHGVALLVHAASGLRYGALSIVAPNGATHVVAGGTPGRMQA